MPDYQIKNKLANLILFFKVKLNQQFLTRYQTWTFLFWSLLKTRSPIPIPGSLDNPSSKTKTKKFPDGDGDVDVDLVRSCSSKSRLEMESIEGKRHHNYGILQPPTPQSSSSFILLQHLYLTNHRNHLLLVADMALNWLPNLNWCVPKWSKTCAWQIQIHGYLIFLDLSLFPSVCFCGNYEITNLVCFRCRPEVQRAICECNADLAATWIWLQPKSTSIGGRSMEAGS